MSIVEQVIFWTTISLEVALLLRAVQTKLLGRFGLFYAYVLFVLLTSVVEYGTFHMFYSWYTLVYWICEFSSALVGCTIIFELYRQSLRPFPLLASMANKVILFVVALVVARILAGTAWTSNLDPQIPAVALERDLRITQAIFLCGLLILVIYYSVSLGRNLKGLTLGYGIYLGLHIAELSARATVGAAFNDAWSHLQSISYAFVLSIWTATLWVKDPVAQQAASPKLEDDYTHLVTATRKRLAQTEEQLMRIIRP